MLVYQSVPGYGESPPGKQQQSQPSQPSQLRFNDTLLKSRSFPCRWLSDFASTGGNSLKNLETPRDPRAQKVDHWQIDRSNQGKKQHIFRGNQVVSREARSKLHSDLNMATTRFLPTKNTKAESHVRDWLKQHLHWVYIPATKTGGRILTATDFCSWQPHLDESRVWWSNSIIQWVKPLTISIIHYPILFKWF